MYFCYFVIISPWKRIVPFIWTKLNPLNPRMLCAKVRCNWPSGSGKEEFQFHQWVLVIFIIVSPLERKWSFVWKKNLNSLYPRMLVRSLVGIGLLLLEKKIFKSCQFIFTISQLFPLGKGLDIHLKKFDSLHPRMFRSKFGWN